MKETWNFLLLVLLWGVAFVTNLLAYTAIEGNFFVFGLFILAVLLVLSVFLYGSWLGTLFSMILFSITLLTGVIMFQGMYPAEQYVISLLLLVGGMGYIVSFMCAPGKCQPCGTTCAPTCGPVVEKYDAPLEKEDLEPMPVMESLDKDEDFVELQEIEDQLKAMQPVAAKRASTRKPARKTVRRKPAKKASTRRRSGKVTRKSRSKSRSKRKPAKRKTTRRNTRRKK